MRDKNVIMCALICSTLIICGVLFWPTLYRYDKIGGKSPVRINRLTGYTEILYGSGWERKVSDQDINSIPKEEIAKIETRGAFDGKGHYAFSVYNGSNWIINKIKLSIELTDGNGKKIWQRIYETTADIRPFSTSSCSIKLMDYAPETDPFVELDSLLDKSSVDQSKIRLDKVKLEGAFGYKVK